MTGQRRGIAMAVALAALVALSALAALSTVTARMAVQEAAALVADAQAERTRAALRGRLARLASAVPRGALLEPHALGSGDTLAVASTLAWPWHRLAVMAGGRTVVAELAYAAIPGLPWCSAVVTGDAGVVPPDAVRADPDAECDSGTVARAPIQDIDGFIASMASALVLSPTPDTLIITGSGVPWVVLGADVVEIAPWTEARGLIVARVIRLGTGASIRGTVVARDSLIAGAGASVQGDVLAASLALAASARLHLAGRRGLLVSP